MCFSITSVELSYTLHSGYNIWLEELKEEYITLWFKEMANSGYSIVEAPDIYVWEGLQEKHHRTRGTGQTQFLNLNKFF